MSVKQWITGNKPTGLLATFTFSRFYRRRAWRIFPVLFAVLNASKKTC